MKKRLAWVVLAALFPGAAATDSEITVPWLEFESIYRQQLEDRLREVLQPEQPVPVFTLDEVSYRLNVTAETATGTATLKGRVVQGTPDRIALFDEQVAVTSVKRIAGARLIADRKGYSLFTREPGEFQLELGIAVPLQERGSHLLLAFDLPPAVSNQLVLELPRDLSLLDTAALRQIDGRYYLAPAQAVALRFERRLVSARDETLVAVDSFTELSLRGDRLRVKSYFLPLEAVNDSLQIQVSPAAAALLTSLPGDAVRPLRDGVLTIDPPTGWHDPFTIQYELVTERDRIELPLPRITGNRAREGEFRIAQTADARIVVANTEVKQDLSQLGLNETLRRYAQLDGPYARIAPHQALQLAVQRFGTLATPDVVLDSIFLYASYTEDGSILKAIRMSLPPRFGERLQLQSMPGAEIWSARVNGEPVRLYTRSADQWVVPLPAEAAADIELAFLQRGPRLGLSGSLELRFPQTGLTARQVNVVVGLSERVDLMALDGELQPVKPQREWPLLAGFSGRPHFFTRPYYRGAAIDAAIHYREPPEGRDAEQTP